MKANTTDTDLAARLVAYCASKRPEADAVEVTGIERIFGGASRETYRFTLLEKHAGQCHSHRLILRRDPTASLIDTARRTEVNAYRLFAGTDVPVPSIWWFEEDPGFLGQPFFVMEAVDDAEAAPMRLMQAPYREHHDHMAEQTWHTLGHIARFAFDQSSLAVDVPVADKCWQRELDHWTETLRREQTEPQPIAEAAIRWLRRHPVPTPQRLSIVHGDYRVGNLMFDTDGSLRAVLDWEMMHIGDPLEDLAWGLNRVWAFQADDRVGGLTSREQAIAFWEQSSGLSVDTQALRWWELFSCVKGQAIWQGAANTFESGANQDLIMAYAAWAMVNAQDRAMLELMGRLQ